MKRKIIYTLLGLTVFGCNTEHTSSTSEGGSVAPVSGTLVISEGDAKLLTASNALAKTSASYIKDNLSQETIAKYFAKSLALALKDKGLAKILKNEIGKKFDGDFNIIWRHIAVQKLGVKNLTQITSDKVVFPDGFSKFSDVMVSFPRMQVACPVHFEDWNPNSKIIVAYQPFTKDDLKTDFLIGYDENLKEVKLDGKIPPTYPVLVITKNERTTNEGSFVPNIFVENRAEQIGNARVLERLAPAKTELAPAMKQSSATRTAATTPVVPLYWKKIKIGSNYDGWFDGSNEVALFPVTDFAKGNSITKDNVRSGNNYTVGAYMFNYNEDLGRYMGMKIMELDDNDADLTILVGLAETIANYYQKMKIEIPYKVDKDDDIIGENKSIELIPQNLLTTFRAGAASVLFDWNPNIVEYNVTAMPFAAASNTLGKQDNWNIDGLDADGEDISYRLVVSGTATKRYVVSTCSDLTNFDTKLQIFDSRSSTPYYNDDAGSSCVGNYNASKVIADLAPGNYFIVVDGYNRATGNFKLTVTESPYP